VASFAIRGALYLDKARVTVIPTKHCTSGEAKLLMARGEMREKAKKKKVIKCFYVKRRYSQDIRNLSI
jgi:hypothetical protein